MVSYTALLYTCVSPSKKPLRFPISQRQIGKMNQERPNGRAALRSRQLEARRATRRRCDAARHCQRLRRQAPGSCSVRTIVWTASLHENLPLECGGLAAFFDEWHLTLRIATHHTLMYTFFVVHSRVGSHVQLPITITLNLH